ncbi:MAG: DUF2934 domain-containing protein [Acidobacteriota bacterium]|jgi:hypothetical protein
MAQTVRKTSASTKPRKTPTKKTAVKAKIAQMPTSHEQVAELAHRFWTERGCQHGYDAEDWFRAEQELRAKAS